MNNKKEYIIISQENRKKDKKIVGKIPILCDKYQIIHGNVSYLLFEIFKKELLFKLSIINNFDECVEEE